LLQGTAVRIHNATEFGVITTATIEQEEEEETVTQHYNNNYCFLRASYSFRGLLLQRERERERERETQNLENFQFRKRARKQTHARVLFFFKYLNQVYWRGSPALINFN